jgi:hypothetical protein
MGSEASTPQLDRLTRALLAALLKHLDPTVQSNPRLAWQPVYRVRASLMETLREDRDKFEADVVRGRVQGSLLGCCRV